MSIFRSYKSEDLDPKHHRRESFKMRISVRSSLI